MLVKNVGGSEAPSGAVMIITGIETLANRRIAYEVDQISIPSENPGIAKLLINSLRPLATSDSEQYGGAISPWNRMLFEVAYDTADGGSQIGDMWGVRDGDWKLRKDEPGFEAIGPHPTIDGIMYAHFIPRPSYYAVLAEDLEAPDDRESPTTATATIQYNDHNGTPGEFKDGPEVEVANRWVDFSIEADSEDDKMIRIEWDWHYLEWSPYVSDCP